MNKKIFLNLTNGIQALDKFDIPPSKVNFIRIQSTYCENASFEKMLLTLDSNFLMWLALGYECVVYDFGAQSETSKAVYYGLEWIRYVLNKRWFGKDTIPYIKGKNVSNSFHKFYMNLGKKTKKQIDYYKKFLMTNELKLTAVTAATEHDNQPEVYFNILKTKLVAIKCD
ncbi:hypothetical protein SDC9_169286 [bioreactor metagenome]|uniref:Uncharacterized protein n=1 Tax=bioreactor metagenome TaxID=1076179 RepID=A0A645GD11_9ZZZZ